MEPLSASDKHMAIVSEKLDKFFTEKMKEYPTQRSFLVPMLLYTQDELGYLPDAAVRYLAEKVALSELEVRNVISYYSMLTTKPRGRFNVEVCTNISCMLRGGEEILEHCEQRLGIGHKQTTPDGMFSLEEVDTITGYGLVGATEPKDAYRAYQYASTVFTDAAACVSSPKIILIAFAPRLLRMIAGLPLSAPRL